MVTSELWKFLTSNCQRLWTCFACLGKGGISFLTNIVPRVKRILKAYVIISKNVTIFSRRNVGEW